MSAPAKAAPEHAIAFEEIKRGPKSLHEISSMSGADFVAAFCAVEMIADPMIPAGALYAFTGKTGHAKTAIITALERAWGVGATLAGVECAEGNVLSLNGENVTDKQARVIATHQEYGRGKPERLRVIAKSFPIAAHFSDLQRDAEAVGGYIAVTVDTSIAFFQGAEENDNVQARMHAADLRMLTTLPGNPAVIVLCHPTKNASADNLLPRGGGAFLNEIDGNLTVWREGDRVTMHWQGKLRGPGFEPVQFALKRVPLEGYITSKGKAVESVVAVPIDDREAEKLATADVHDENRVLWAMLHYPAGSLSDWAIHCGWATPAGAPLKSKVHRLIERLAADKLVSKVRNRWELSDRGKREAEAIQ